MKSFKVFTASLFLSSSLGVADTLEVTPIVDPYIISEDQNGVKIFLTSTIEDADAYQGLIKFIITRTDLKDVNLYLSGFGGSINGLKALINAIQISGVRYHMIVYGDIYSAHTTLALAGTTVEFANENLLIVFHRPALQNTATKKAELYEIYCKNMLGTDRGVSLSYKCFQENQKLDELQNASIYRFNRLIFNKREMINYQNGYDIVFSSGELKKRLKAAHLLGE